MKRRTTEESIRFGLYLSLKRISFSHGQFMPWVERNIRDTSKYGRALLANS